MEEELSGSSSKTTCPATGNLTYSQSMPKFNAPSPSLFSYKESLSLPGERALSVVHAPLSSRPLTPVNTSDAQRKQSKTLLHSALPIMGQRQHHHHRRKSDTTVPSEEEHGVAQSPLVMTSSDTSAVLPRKSSAQAVLYSATRRQSRSETTSVAIGVDGVRSSSTDTCNADNAEQTETNSAPNTITASATIGGKGGARTATSAAYFLRNLRRNLLLNGNLRMGVTNRKRHHDSGDSTTGGSLGETASESMSLTSFALHSTTANSLQAQQSTQSPTLTGRRLRFAGARGMTSASSGRTALLARLRQTPTGSRMSTDSRSTCASMGALLIGDDSDTIERSTSGVQLTHPHPSSARLLAMHDRSISGSERRLSMALQQIDADSEHEFDMEFDGATSGKHIS
jgi:hypothetical protein